MTLIKAKVLLVEDHKLTREMGLIILRSLVCEVHGVSNAADAITRCKEQIYDIVLMDLGLPDIDGYTATETLRILDAERERHTPIIALTAYTDNSFKYQAIQSGMDDFLSKPLTLDKLKTIIDRHFLRRKFSRVSTQADEIFI